MEWYIFGISTIICFNILVFSCAFGLKKWLQNSELGSFEYHIKQYKRRESMRKSSQPTTQTLPPLQIVVNHDIQEEACDSGVPESLSDNTSNRSDSNSWFSVDTMNHSMNQDYPSPSISVVSCPGAVVVEEDVTRKSSLQDLKETSQEKQVTRRATLGHFNLSKFRRKSRKDDINQIGKKIHKVFGSDHQVEDSTKAEFKVRFDNKSGHFTMTLERFKPIPSHIDPYSIYVKAKLFPRGDERDISSDHILHCKDTDNKTLDEEEVTFSEPIIFNDMDIHEIEKSTIVLTVHACKRKDYDDIVGEVFVNLSEIEMSNSLVQPLHSRIIQTKRKLKRKSTVESCLMFHMGELMILMQYKSYAERMKILVTKAHNIPKPEKNLTVIKYHVVIHLYVNDTLQAKRETKKQGYPPIWNEPFLFDIPSEKIANANFEFILCQGQFLRKDKILGHVRIGKDTTKSGIMHWSEVLMPHGLEVAKYHHILPVFKY